MKKIIITDLDGTVVNSPIQKLPTDKMINAVNLLKTKYYVCAATGRPWSFAKNILKSLNLTDHCIIAGGTQICNPQTGEIIWQKNIESESLIKVIDIMKLYPDYGVIYNDYTENDYFNGGDKPNTLNISETVYFIEQVFIPNKIAYEIEEKLELVDGVTCTMVVSQKVGCKDLHRV